MEKTYEGGSTTKRAKLHNNRFHIKNNPGTNRRPSLITRQTYLQYSGFAIIISYS